MTNTSDTTPGPDDMPEVVPPLRCAVTHNQCGTDTWMAIGGKLIPCSCSECQKYEYFRRGVLAERACSPDLFVDGDFVAHSGETLGFKIECNALTDADLATLARQFAKENKFGTIFSVPRGGDRFAAALRKYSTSGPTLIVDDVLTTGASIEHARRVASNQTTGTIYGVVIFARGHCPEWIMPMFSFRPRAPEPSASERTIEQRAWGLVNEHGPGWANWYWRKWPDSKQSRKELQREMAHYCVVAALKECAAAITSAETAAREAAALICDRSHDLLEQQCRQEPHKRDYFETRQTEAAKLAAAIRAIQPPSVQP